MSGEREDRPPTDRERWVEVERVLDGALDLPEAERAEFVRRSTDPDRALEAEVLELLKACADGAELLAEPPPLVARDILENPPPPEDEFEPGDLVGSYQVVRLLGRGGMGAVYLADRADGFFEKQVALKVIKRADGSEETLRRFEAERQILARLEHPDIVGILDGGITEDGMPFVVMDLAVGEPIDLFCDRLRLSVAKRVTLFRRVCDAVQYAHRNLVVHRDLKPSNILITATGDVRLLDFGIATVLGAESASEEGSPFEPSPRLTPEYAAPEQILEEPTTAATDVYSLGVILYELLTGERPYAVGNLNMAGIRKVVCTTEPLAPSRHVTAHEAGDRAASLRSTTRRGLGQTLGGDLDAIILKAIEKVPDQRYGSVSELSEDLRRHVEGRPVRARPATRLYRSAKFLRRYPVQLAAVGTALVLLVGGIISTTVQLQTAERERQLREQEAQRAGLAESMLLSTFADLGESHRGSQPIPPADIIDAARLNLTRLAASPRLRAGLKNKLGTISLNLSQFPAADTLFYEALDALEGMEGAELDRAEAMTGLGFRSLRGSQRGDSAVTWFSQALDERRSVLDPSDTLITQGMTNLGFSLYADDQYPESIALLRETLERPTTPLERARGLEFMTNVLARYSRVLADSGKVKAAADTLLSAEAHTLEALAILRNEGASNRPQFGNTLLTLAQVRVAEGHGVEAEEAAFDALRTYQEIVGPHSQRTASAWAWIGNARLMQGRTEEAIEAMETAISIFDSIAPGSGLRTSLSLGRARQRQGNFEAAERLFRGVLEIEPERPVSERLLALELLEDLYAEWQRPVLAGQIRNQREALERGPP